MLTLSDAQGRTESITCTAEHPFWVPGRGWTAAKDLAPGMELSSPDGSLVVVVANATRVLDKPVSVYNFQVEGDHTYFVDDGAEPVWVHNACGVYTEVRDGVTKYVGASRNVARRTLEWARAATPRIVEPIRELGNIGWRQARALEHLLIEKYGRFEKDVGGILENINRGIDPAKLSKYEKQLEWAREIIQELGL